MNQYKRYIFACVLLISNCYFKNAYSWSSFPPAINEHTRLFGDALSVLSKAEYSDISRFALNLISGLEAEQDSLGAYYEAAHSSPDEGMYSRQYWMGTESLWENSARKYFSYQVEAVDSRGNKSGMSVVIHVIPISGTEWVQ